MTARTRLLLIAVSGVCLLAAAAGATPNGRVTIGADEQPVVARGTYHGACQPSTTTVCSEDFLVTDAGHWLITRDGARVVASGTLPDADLDRLDAALGSTALGDLTSTGGVCASDSGGTDTRYGWLTQETGQWTTVTSCGSTIPSSDPLVQVLDELAARYQGRR